IVFRKSTPHDAILAAAITNHGNVIIAAELEEMGEMLGSITNDPAEIFCNLSGCQVAFAENPKHTVRTFPVELEYHPSVPLAAAAAYGKRVEARPKERRWVRYYGDGGRDGLPTIAYEDAWELSEASFKQTFANKVVFIGGKTKVQYPGEKPDQFETPFTRWTGNKMRGVELLATMFGNLINNEWLTEASRRDQALGICAAALLFGFAFASLRPLPGLIVLLAGAIGVSALGIILFWTQRVWFNWALIGWIEIPIAWATAAIVYSRIVAREKDKLDREKESLIKELDSYKSGAHAGPAFAGGQSLAAHAVADIKAVAAIDAPTIPNYELIRKIDEGAYGQVWLARDLTDVFHAVKIIYRKNFSEQRPFEREFEGVKNFVTFSRSHPGCVNVRHVGKDQVGGFFYYVMEPADDLVRGPNIDPTQYVPRTLSKLLVENRVLPVLECVDLGIEVASALSALHGHRLVHRDVKPANIIFANNKPRLADIGLVARMDEQLSVNGTEGYMPDDHLGTPVADTFSLGRVLYVASTGCPATRHPGLPTSLDERKDARELMRLMEIINKACAQRYEERYQSAAEMRDDLVKLRTRLSGARL
ncbi:MAG TPA: serine/threonine-protein kinase, partial [Verrucomicrobiae bacterium]|nr:serine/threonine-protein kinase [Verrucomicrobiae bacterium]